MPRFSSPRGTHDVLPEEAAKWQWICGAARDVLRRYGYREIRTPLIEDAGLFLRGVGEATDIVVKEMYIFKDRKGRSLALRPEGTASVARAYIQHHLEAEREIQKLYYLGPMFRYDRPQAGRNRQFFQIGSEAIGSASPLLDLETIMLWRDIFTRLGLSEVSIALNSVGCRSCRPMYQEAIRDALADVKDGLCTDCQGRYLHNPLRILDCKVAGCRELREVVPSIMTFLCEGCRRHHETVREKLGEWGCDFIDDPHLVRGLDYYTKTAFEVVHGGLGSQNSLGGGGRYDDLVAVLDGGDVPAVGFSAGLERIVIAMDEEGVSRGEVQAGEGTPDYFLVYTDERSKEEALRTLFQLRRSFRVDIDYTGRSLKGQFRQAHRLGARRVLIFGPDELRRGCVRMRDMAGGKEEEIRLDDLTDALEEDGVS